MDILKSIDTAMIQDCAMKSPPLTKSAFGFSGAIVINLFMFFLQTNQI